MVHKHCNLSGMSSFLRMNHIKDYHCCGVKAHSCGFGSVWTSIGGYYGGSHNCSIGNSLLSGIGMFAGLYCFSKMGDWTTKGISWLFDGVSGLFGNKKAGNIDNGGDVVKDDKYFARRYGGTRATATTGTGSATAAASANPNSAPVQGQGQEQGGGKVELTDDQISINGIPMDISGIESNDFITYELTKDEWEKIDKNKAQKLLEKFNMYVDKDKGVAKMSTNYNILMLLQKAEVIVECAKNQNAADKFIKGKISNVKINDGKVSFDIDCKDISDAIYEYKYSFIQTGDKTFNLTEIDSNGSGKYGYVINNWKERDYEVNGDGILEFTGDDPLISEHSSPNRKQLAAEKPKATQLDE